MALILVALGAPHLVGGCGGASTPGQQEPTVVLSAEAIAGPGGVLRYGGRDFTGNVEVPSNAIVGAVKEGEAYLYHPALGDVPLSVETSRRALGYHMVGYGVDVPSPPTAPSDYAAVRVDELRPGEGILLSTGVHVYRLNYQEVSVRNLSRRATAVKRLHDELPSDPADRRTTFLLPWSSAFLSAQYLTFATQLRSQYTDWDFETGEGATLKIRSGTIETYGAFVRAAPVWRKALSAESWWPPRLLSSLAEESPQLLEAQMPPGVVAAMQSDSRLLARLNAFDFGFAYFGLLRYLGGAIGPEALDGVLQPLISAVEAMAYTWGVQGLDPDGHIVWQVFMSALEGFAQSFIGACTPLLEPVWSAMDVVCLLGWIFDQQVAANIDAMKPAFATVEIPRLDPPTYWSKYGANLVRNGDAEAGASSHDTPGTGDGLHLVAIPDWHWLATADGKGWVVEYDRSGGGVGLGSGKQFLVGGVKGSSLPALVQHIDLSPIRGDIEAGRVTYRLTASIGVGGPASAELGIRAEGNAHVEFGWTTETDDGLVFTGIDRVFQYDAQGPARLEVSGDLGRIYRGDYCVWVWGGSADDIALVLQGSGY